MISRHYERQPQFAGVVPGVPLFTSETRSWHQIRQPGTILWQTQALLFHVDPSTGTLRLRRFPSKTGRRRQNPRRVQGTVSESSSPRRANSLHRGVRDTDFG
jgi:hypothetical protein